MKLNKKLLRSVFCLILSLSMLGSSMAVAFAAPETISVPELPVQDGITPEEIDTMALDPQQWELSRDMDWNDFKPNPVIDWNEELKTESLEINTNLIDVEGRKIKGGLVLVDFLDKKMISGQPVGTEPLGYYRFNKDVVGEEGKEHGSYETTISKNPVTSILDYPEEYPNGYADLPRYWAEFLNTPNKDNPNKPLNHGATINEYWLENSYGKWGVELIPKGVFTIPYFEFETMGSYQNARDVPPTFRHALPSGTSTSVAGSGNTRSSSVDSHGTELAKRGSVFGLLEGETTNPWGIPDGARGMNSSAPVDFSEFDFFFLLSAGYDESGVWQEFGQSQFASREDVPYELGPGNRLKIVEKFFNDYPEWVPVYAARYENGWANYTGVWNTAQYNANNEAVVAKVNEYREHAFWKETLEKWKIKYDPTHPNYNADATFEFKLPQEDWDWAEKYQGSSTDYVGRSHSTNTRYVAFTAWEAAVGEWSHAGSVQGNAATYGNTNAGKQLRRSCQGENDGMGTYAHEFSHLADISDNYGNPWSDRLQARTEPWCIMSRGSFAGPYGDHARWLVPGLEASSVPAPATQSIKSAWNYYANYTNTEGALNEKSELRVVSVEQLANGTPVVEEIVPRGIPLNNEYYNVGVSRDDFVKGIQVRFATGSTSPYRDKSVRSTVGYTNFKGNQGTRMGVEVVERTGYDSFSHDEGVILTRVWSNTNSGHSVVDSHLYDIDMTDFYVGGEPSAYPIGHATQLVDAAFKVGKSFTDTGYYAGSEWKWEDQKDRAVVSGDSVNEWLDPYNGLHFYILQKNINEGKFSSFLSYQVGVLHEDGQPVGGNLLLEEKAGFVPAVVGNYAKQTYKLTNTGDATDIVRITLDGALAGNETVSVQVKGNIPDLPIDQNTREIPTAYSERNAVLLNDLYAVGAGETIEFDVYVKTTTDVLADFDLTVVASSETNGSKYDTISILGELFLNTDAHLVNKGDYFNLYPTFDKPISSNTAMLNFAFDKDLFEFRGFFPEAGVTLLDNKETADGYSLTVMVDNYKTQAYGRVLFSAKEDADLQNEDHEISVAAQYVWKFEDGEKEVWTATASTAFTSTHGKDPFPPPGGEFTLITLSNIIDYFGATPANELWLEIIRFFDYNNNKVIDIHDITTVAQKIVQ